MFKTCTKCQTHLALDKFHRLKKGKLGRHPQCKTCRKKSKKINPKNPTQKSLCCYECGKVKSCDFFYKNKANKTGYQLYCKDCHRLKISISMSKLENYFKILLKKFKRKHKKYVIDFSVIDLMQIFRNQEECCAVTKHKLKSVVDLQQRIDNIWNISICMNASDIVNNKVTRNNIYLVCNLVYSTQKLYNLSKTQLIEIYKQIQS